MTKVQYWGIIEEAHTASGGDMDRKCELLRDRLSHLDADSIRAFSLHFDDCDVRAYHWGLWGAAYIIHGGCSDDAFSDFRSTLISHGRDIFERALADPDSLADLPFWEDNACYEGYQYVVSEAEERILGHVPPRATTFPTEPGGEPWKEDDKEELKRRFPRLYHKHSLISRPHSGRGNLSEAGCLGELIRVVLAGLFVFLSLCVVVVWIGTNHDDHAWPGWAAPALMMTGVTTSFLSLFLFNKRGLKPNFTTKSLEQYIAELDRKGFLIRENFRATRAFGVENCDDEGPHYYLELEDGRVLYLNGPYLFDFEPIEEGESEENQPRQFPCTEFQILTAKDNEYFVTLRCRGSVLEPELMAPHFTREDFKQGLPQDRDIITGPSYDEIKAQRGKD